MNKYSNLAEGCDLLTSISYGARQKFHAACATALRELEAENERLQDDLFHARSLAKEMAAEAGFLEAERDRLRKTGNWLAAEARENWEEGRLSIDLLTAVEVWENISNDNS
jgi:hypothetical protein